MSAETDHYDCCIDAVGLVCPEPLMIVRNKVREMRRGEVLFVVATDPATDRDFRDFCRFMGHELVSKAQDGDRLEYRIRKGA
ncbi:MAG: sulfurtransferase TusA [Gammaproteobacteria bacterium]|nr:sulfurtransferase TusA [Gammaproteobacteria bacterium]MDE0367176.1 sulfurtransferase TusA [Gammaproteobacteria bacterium]